MSPKPRTTTEPKTTQARPTFAFVSLGCPKNLVDSERMLGLLASEGYVPVPDPRGADMVVVNTCGFIESSRQESKAVIHEMLELKAKGEVGGVLVTGCLAERMGPELITEIPHVDAAVGVFGREEIGRIADRFLSGALEQRTLFRPAAVKALDDTARLRITPRHYAYLKISEGCDRTCTFCAIPKMRGKHVTKPIEQVVAEARELAADGVRELILVSQDTTYYGKDLYGRVRLKDLFGELENVDGLDWIRVLYAYPEHVDDELIETLAGSERFVPYLDMPLQHISDRVLRRMQRRHDRKTTEEIVGKLRRLWPDVALRTTFIVGFPGETEKDFQELLEFVERQRFEHLGVFTYSIEEGTAATRLDGHLPEEVKAERRERLMLAQQRIAFERAHAAVGEEVVVVVDGVDPDEDEGRVCRTAGQAPEIDTVVYLGPTNLPAGKFSRARIVDVHEGYDWVAEPLGEPW